MAEGTGAKVLREVSEEALFEVPLRRLFERIMLAAHADVAQPGRVPIDTNRLRASLAPGGGVTAVEGSFESGFVAILGTNVQAYPRALEAPETRTPHYRGGPSTGQPTDGWLSKTKPAVEAQIPGFLSALARDMEAAFNG